MTPGIAILKPGTFTDVRGARVTFTRRDLDEVAATYDASRHPAPLVIGHPEAGAAEYGHVARMEVVGDVLRAHPARIAPAFAEAVAAGRYRKVSPQLFTPRSTGNPTPGRWHLQHVGFLGGAAPAIKGLGTVSFAQVDTRAAVAVAIEAVPAVSFAAPAGYAVDERHAALHARARALQASDPQLSSWDAFTRARYEASIVSLAAPDDADPQPPLLLRARAIRAIDPGITFWDAFVRARSEAA